MLLKALEQGKSLPTGALDSALDTATRLGDVETSAKLITGRQVYAQRDATRGLTDEERVRQATAVPVAPANISGTIASAAAKYGIDPAYLNRVAHIESRFDPNAVNAGSGATGLFQFIPSTWKQYGAGQSARDPEANADAAARFTVANRNQLRASLGREPTHGELYLAHQQGAGGAAKLLAAPNARAVDVVGERAVLGNGGTLDMTAGQFAQKWIRKADGAPGAPPPASPAVAPFTQEQLAANPYLASTWLRSQLAGNRELVESAQFIISGASNAIDKGIAPDPQTLAGALQIADANPEKLGRARDALVAKIRGAEVGEEANAAGPLAGEALVQEAMRRAQGAPILVQMQAEATKEAVERGTRAMASDPWNEAGRRGWIDGAPPSLDYSSPAALAAGFDVRLKAAQAIQSRTGLPQSVLSPSDLASTVAIWASGSPASRSMLAEQIGSLPPDQRGLVMGSKEVRESMVGMSRSGDPAKMSVAFSLMALEQQRDPDGFHRLYGRDVENRMAAWVSRSQYLSPEQLAREEARYNDPAMRKAREEMSVAAMTATAKLTASTIAGYVGGSWLPFSSPGAPVIPAQAQRLVADYRQEYAATFAEIGDETKARELTVQRIGRVWGVSPTNRGNLMRYPPEKGYPTIDQSHDWIGKQLDDEMRQVIVGQLSEAGQRLVRQPAAGERRVRASDMLAATPDDRTAASRAQAMLSAPRMLVADPRTEAEFRAGQPPTYPVVILAPDGRYVPLQNDQGQPLRFRGDVDAATNEARARAEVRLEQVRGSEAARSRLEADARRRRDRREARRTADGRVAAD